MTDDRPTSHDTARGSIAAGLIIIGVFFGGLGTWAAIAPLNGAAIGEGMVKVEGNRKSVQHLDGGIVKELHVKEGDRVALGDVLIVLDNTEVHAEVDVLSRQAALLEAVEARLQAEFAGAPEITLPPSLASRAADPLVAGAIAAQRREFQERRLALLGQARVLEQRIAQLKASAAGAEAQRDAYQLQLTSILDEESSLQGLYDKGLVTRARLLQLDRTAAGIKGQVAEAAAEIEKLKEEMAQTSAQITQLSLDRSAVIANDLRDVQGKLLEIAPRLKSARSVEARTVVRSPYAGIVVGLAVFSVGGVVGRGERILDIVPEQSALVVEARIALDDIAEVRPGMRAEVHLSAYKQRTAPLVHGTVTDISADRLIDEKTGAAYYLAQVTVDAKELAASPSIRLYPGMLATVMVTTEERTALDYLVGPLLASFDRSFRQR